MDEVDKWANGQMSTSVHLKGVGETAKAAIGNQSHVSGRAKISQARRPAPLARRAWQFPTRRFPTRHDGIDLGQTAPLITQTATYPLSAFDLDQGIANSARH